MFSAHQRTVAARFAVIAFSIAISACTSIPAGDPESVDADEQTGVTTQALSGAHKMCSGFTAGSSRDTIIVSNWHPNMCWSWAASISSGTWQLGCITDTSYSWGNPGGGLPPNNSCGWTY